MNLKVLLNKKTALFIEKVSIQIMGVIFILSVFNIKLTTILSSLIWITLSEIVWYLHPKTRGDVSFSLFIIGLFSLYFSPLIGMRIIAASLKCLGVLLLILGAVRNIWKVSGHVAGASFIFTISSILGHTFLSGFSLLILPLVSWSRLRLKRHDIYQVLGGLVLGFAVPIMFI
jgi:membrane-associated phospholipid phosphatase